MLSNNKVRLRALHPLHITSYGTGHVAFSLLKSIRSDDFEASLFSLSCDRDIDSEIHSSRLYGLHKKLAYRFYSREKMLRIVEEAYLETISAGDIAYLWPGCSLELYKEIKRRGAKLVMERINCHRATINQILRDAESRTGIPPARPVVTAHIGVENEKLAIADAVFAPSSLVRESLLENGIESDKIVSTSYGLKASQLCTGVVNGDRPGAKNAVFVGRVGIRKGADLLLRYWKEADVDADLIFIGQIEPSFQPIVDMYKHEGNIRFLKFVNNVPELLSQADAFILPSLEEGSPLATYEAIGVGLPCLVTPMGGGGIVVDQVSGRVIEPHDSESWKNAIRELMSSESLRAKFSKNAHSEAKKYLWSRVAGDRVNKLRNILTR